MKIQIDSLFTYLIVLIVKFVSEKMCLFVLSKICSQNDMSTSFSFNGGFKSNGGNILYYT